MISQLMTRLSNTIKQVSKVSTGQDHDYATGSLLDFACFEKNTD